MNQNDFDKVLTLKPSARFLFIISLSLMLSSLLPTVPQSMLSFGAAPAAASTTVGSAPCVQTVNSATGVTVTQSGPDCIIRFTNTAAATTWTAPSNISNLQVLVVGGGGGGGGGSRARNDGGRGAGGGGAGGAVYYNSSLNITGGTSFEITVGAGGAGGAANNAADGLGAAGAAGSPSAIAATGFTTITASGGGAGGGQSLVSGGLNDVGGDGGSTSLNVAGSTTPRTGGFNNYEGAGGGAGAGGDGVSGTDIGGRGGNGGSGGAGYLSTITGSEVRYAGGGGGGGTAGDSLNGSAGSGGSGGGGRGGIYQTSPVAGTAQLGGGGGGGGGYRDANNPARDGAAGGSGVVIIRYTVQCQLTPNTVVTNDLVLYLDAADPCSTGTSGRWRDLSGNNNDLTWTSAPNLVTQEPKFYDFVRGSGHRGTFGTAAASSFESGFSISFFARFDGAGTWERIIDFGRGQQLDNIVVHRDGASSRLGFTVYRGSAFVLRYISPDQMIVDGQWAHYAISVTAAGNVVMYRDGVEQRGVLATRVDNTPLSSAADRTLNYLGQSNWADPYFDGGLGSISLYNRALTASEVATNVKHQSRSISSQAVITDGAKYTVTTFTSVGSNIFTVPDGVTSLEVLLVGGGGGAGFGNCGGGGGAGALLVTSSALTVTPGQTFDVFVGGGGVGGWNSNDQLWSSGHNGAASTVRLPSGDLITATGGGGGGGSAPRGGDRNGAAGGSGGGGVACGASGTGGSPDSTVVTGFTKYANAGRTGTLGVSSGGGGGAGGAATDRNGGAGRTIWGTALAGGGAGWASATGGSGGGGNATGSYNLATPLSAGSPGAFGTGSGGGGGNNGGSGRVAFRYGNVCDPIGSNFTATATRIGDDCEITFTQTSTNAKWEIPAAVNQFSVLVVGGGGGGGFDAGAGGGGGAVYVGTVSLAAGAARTADISIGAGGNPSRHSQGSTGSDGGNSSLAIGSAGNIYSIVAAGGKLGGNSGATTAGVGGAGGVAPVVTDSATTISGTSSVSSAGGNGGNGVPYNSTQSANAGTGGIASAAVFGGSYGGGGGGGATQYGAANPGRAGGAGVNGGGTGSGGFDSASGRVTSFAVAGSANTGGGGGGGSAHGTTASFAINGETYFSRDAKAGGSGIIKIRYSLKPAISISPTQVNGGFDTPITSYAITNTGSAATSYSISPALPATSGLTFNTTTGLISGTPTLDVSSDVDLTEARTYDVTATNSYGSATATFVLKIFDATNPTAPTINSIIPGAAQLKINLSPPTSTGGEAITGYRYSTNGGSTYSAPVSATGSGSSLSLTITGLTNGTEYDIKLKAVNPVGDSGESNEKSGTPYAACQTTTTNTATHVIVEITNTAAPCTWPSPTATAEILIVGGGGGGGQGWGGGGGGGGVLHSTSQTIATGDTLVITVGAGGNGGTSNGKGSNGQASSINFLVGANRETYTANGGGGGGGYGWGLGVGVGTGVTGGSAGGHGEIPNGNTLPIIAGTQSNIGTFTGYAGAGGSMYGGGSQAGSGGGGAGGNGGNVTSYRAPGVGGAGRLFDLVSSPGVYYAGGGGGGSITGAAGGVGGGGRGSNNNGSPNAANGVDGLGGGGGGSSSGAAGGKGGSGIVIIKYSNEAGKTTFDPQNGENPTEIAQAEFTSAPITPIKLGYTLVGWFDAATDDAANQYFTTAFPKFTPTGGGENKLYARWTVKPCTVTESNFVGTGANGGTAGVTYRVFSFNTPGDCVWQLPSGLTNLSVLAVGGGGGGGGAFDTGGGGGGGGGQVKQETISVAGITELVIVVGRGGSAGLGTSTGTGVSQVRGETAGGNGSVSELYRSGVRIVSALGGNGGSASRADYFIATGLATTARTIGAGGAAATATDPARGGAPGGNTSSATAGAAGGGGGSVGVGGNATTDRPGAGGQGTSLNLTGAARTYGAGGAGGDGKGTTGSAPGSPGQANSGNGGGGASAQPSSAINGGAGGSGVIILRGEVTAQRYSVTYDVSGGTPIANGSFVAGGSITRPNSPVKAGYALLGWAVNNTTTDVITFPYSPGVTTDITLYAVWSANTISVVFHLNDGTPETKVQNITAGTATNLANNTFERAGFTFAGWATSSASSSAVTYTNGQSVTLVGPTDLYAKWIAQPVKAIFFPNYGDGAAIEQTITADVLTQLRANTFTRSGYAFSGWTNSAGEKVGDAVRVRIYVNTSYFANWTPIGVSVTYNLNGGAGTAPTQEAVTAGATFDVAAGVTRDGFAFAGWSDGSKLYQSGDVYTVETGAVYLTAQWDRNRFAITYDKGTADSGELVIANQSVPVTQNTIQLPGRGTLVKAGSAFGGWSDGTTTHQAGTNYLVTGDVTLTAVWNEVTTLTVSYNTNGGAGLLRVSDAVISGDTIALPAETLTKARFSFGGWSDGTNTYAPSATYPNAGGVTSDVTLSAVWTKTQYRVTYNANGGTLGTTSQDVTIGQAIATLPTDVTRTGHTFAGWSETRNGVAITAPYTPADDVTLFARWQATITYDLNGATGDVIAPATYDVGAAAVTLPKSGDPGFNLSKGTDVFGGWSISQTAISGVTTYIPSGNTLLYAVWKPLYTITYQLNTDDVGTTPTAVTAAAGSLITLHDGSNIAKTDHVFVGWSDGAKQYNVANSFQLVADITLSPAWVPYLRVTYVLNGGVGTFNSVTLTSGDVSAYTIQTPPPTRSGYEFKHWRVTTYVGQTLYATADVVSGDVSRDTEQEGTLIDTIVLSAVWTQLFTISYDKNYDAGGSARAVSQVAEGSSITLPTDVTRTGYELLGWATTPTGSVLSSSYSPAADVTLYAIWERVYSVTYVLGDGATGTVPTQAAVKSTLTFTVQDPTSPVKTHYSFIGWSDGVASYVKDDVYTVTNDDVVLTAIWARNSYLISYDLNGGSASAAIPSVRVAGGDIHTPSITATLTKTNATFSHWSVTPTGETIGNSYTPTSSATLYAIWQNDKVRLSYDDGTTTDVLTDEFEIGQLHTVEPAVSRANQSFLGWKIKKADNSGETYLPNQNYLINAADVSADVSGDVITFEALWSEIKYLVKYDLAGGSGTAPTQTPVISGDVITVKSHLGGASGDVALFERTNHKFLRWEVGGVTKAVNSTITVTQDVTITAIWEPVINISFNSNGGRFVSGDVDASGDVTFIDDPTITYTGTAIPKPTDPRRADFVFGGWAVEDSDLVLTNDVGWSNFVPTDPVTLTAIWTQLSLSGIDTSKLVRLGTLSASDTEEVSFTGSNSTNAVEVVVPAGSLPAGTKINIDSVSDDVNTGFVRAKRLISDEVDFLTSLVIHWLAADGTVPKTDPDKPIMVTVYNPTVKSGSIIYKIIGDEFTVLGRASEDGVVTFPIYEDPEVLIAATRPDAPINVTAVARSWNDAAVTWVAPVLDGGSPITGYRATANNGRSCTTTGLTCTISGLSQSTQYTFTVVAINIVGESIESIASAAVTTPRRPSSRPRERAEVTPTPPTPTPTQPEIRPTPTRPVLETLDGRSIVTPRGEARLIIDGSVVTNRVDIIDNRTIRTTFGDVTFEITGIDRTDRITNITGNALVFERNGKASLTGKGLQPGSTLRIWLLSDPVFLGETKAAADGSFDLASLIPPTMPLGEHTLQVNGVTGKNQLVTQTFGVVIVDKIQTDKPGGNTANNRVLNLSMLATQFSPTTKQLTKARNLAKRTAAKSVVTCNAYVAAATPTAAQLRQATRVADLLCAPFRAKKTITTKFTKKAPANAATLKGAKRKPIRVEVFVRPGK